MTNGASRPPAWALHPDGRSAYVATGNKDMVGVQGCLPPLEHGRLFWLAEHAEIPHEHILAKGPVPADIREPCGEELEVDRAPLWSPDGNRLYVANRSKAFVVDVPTGAPLWLTHRVDQLAEWSPDGRFLAHLHKGLLHFRDADTGRPAADPAPTTGSRSNLSLHWGMRGDTARLAAVLSEKAAEPGVEIYDDGRLSHRLAVTPAETALARENKDFAVWAWAPSGNQGAVLTAAGDIEIWSMSTVTSTAEPRARRAHLVPAHRTGHGHRATRAPRRHRGTPRLDRRPALRLAASLGPVRNLAGRAGRGRPSPDNVTGHQSAAAGAVRETAG